MLSELGVLKVRVERRINTCIYIKKNSKDLQETIKSYCLEDKVLRIGKEEKQELGQWKRVG